MHPEERKMDPEVSIEQLLRPGSDSHDKLLNYLKTLLKLSEDQMKKMYPRWRVNEMQMQAYVKLNDFEQMLKEANESGKPASPVSISVPFSFATVQTIVTYLFHTFASRKPLFALGAHNAKQADKVMAAEQLLQYNCDRTNFIRQLYQMLLDDTIYGFGAMRMLWTSKKRRFMVSTAQEPQVEILVESLIGTRPPPKREMQERVVFEGSDVSTIDPWCFFPDPRVPLADLSNKGEFVFWRAYVGKHTLRMQESDGKIFHVKAIGAPLAVDDEETGRGLSSGSNMRFDDDTAQRFHQIDQGACWIIPNDFGLSSSTRMELWLFTIANKKQVIGAEPLDLFHSRLPVECCESSSFGYSFNNLSTVDMLRPMQDIMSWLVNSHLWNVRATSNNQFVVNPRYVEMSDFENPNPGRLIRLKNTPFGDFNIDQAVRQLQTFDVTRGHMSELNDFARMGAELTGASDNLRGIQESGGRKTATEVRVSGEAGASRLAARARLISAQAVIGIAEQMLVNYQQFMTKEYEFKILGSVGETSLIITPDELNEIDFHFPVHDGTLPLDKMGMVDIWREIFMGVLSDPTGQLRQAYDVTKIFEHVARLGGAENIENFRIAVAPPEADLAAQAAAGNMIPLEQAAGALQ
jgi:hypothetical protein